MAVKLNMLQQAKADLENRLKSKRGYRYPRTCCLACKVSCKRTSETVYDGIRVRRYRCPECGTVIVRFYYLFVPREGATYIYRPGKKRLRLRASPVIPDRPVSGYGL